MGHCPGQGRIRLWTRCFEDPARLRRQGHPDRLIHHDVRELVLVDLGLEPEHREVRDAIELHRRLDVAAFQDLALEHRAADRGPQDESFPRLTGFLQMLDLVFGHAPQLQPPAGGRGQLALRVAFGSGLHAPQRDQVFLLRRQQLRAVDLDERISPAYLASDEIDVDRFDPAADPGMDAGQAGLVRLDDANRADRHDELIAGDLAGADADELLAIRADRDDGVTGNGGGLGGVAVGPVLDVRRGRARARAQVAAGIQVHGRRPEQQARDRRRKVASWSVP